MLLVMKNVVNSNRNVVNYENVYRWSKQCPCSDLKTYNAANLFFLEIFDIFQVMAKLHVILRLCDCTFIWIIDFAYYPVLVSLKTLKL